MASNKASRIPPELGEIKELLTKGSIAMFAKCQHEARAERVWLHFNKRMESMKAPTLNVFNRVTKVKSLVELEAAHLGQVNAAEEEREVRLRSLSEELESAHSLLTVLSGTAQVEGSLAFVCGQKPFRQTAEDWWRCERLKAEEAGEVDLLKVHGELVRWKEQQEKRKAREAAQGQGQAPAPQAPVASPPQREVQDPGAVRELVQQAAWLERRAAVRSGQLVDVRRVFSGARRLQTD